MNKPNCRLPTHKMANGKNHGDQATKAMAAPITAQQWATQAKPRQLERPAKIATAGHLAVGRVESQH